MSVYEQKLGLYKDYAAELDKIAGREPIPEAEAEQTAAGYISAGYAHWENIWSPDGELAGFLIVCRKPECHPEADYFIAQLYVRPECRRKGYAEKTVLRFLSGHPGTYCKVMIEGNKAGYAFWADIRKKAKAKNIGLPRIAGAEQEGEKQYAFRIRSTTRH